MELKANYRILHFLSPVKWEKKVFINDADANWKVAKKTIDFLPNCHHFIITPLEHNIEKKDNITFIEYDYPKSVQLIRGMFDYRNVSFDFTKYDIDFVFNHQPEITFNIQQWFHTKRYYEDVKYFNFFHWIDCNKSRGSTTGCPSFYMRQLESMTISHRNFVHTNTSIDYMMENFKKKNYTPSVDNISYMPLSGDIVENVEQKENLSNVLVFNHRWNKSSGIKRFEKYLDIIPKEYKIWVTDEKCDIEDERIIKKRCDEKNFNILMTSCKANLSFIDGYSTWNLSAQDCLMRGKPLLAYRHPMLENLLGDDYPYFFENEEDFIKILTKLPKNLYEYKEKLSKWDDIFKNNLIQSMNELWKDTKKPPKDAPSWMDKIENNIHTKKEIAPLVNPRVKLNGTAHYVRRHLLHNGYKYDFNSSETYYIKWD